MKRKVHSVLSLFDVFYIDDIDGGRDGGFKCEEEKRE